VLNVSTLIGARDSASDALRYGEPRAGERLPRSSLARRPVVVWNSTKACNLQCAHCYASATRRAAPDELTSAEAIEFLDDLAAFGVPAVLLSGGEPLVRPDLLGLIEHGREHGLRFTLSSNGTCIDDRVAAALAGAGITYVGVSIDGTEAVHDRLRREPGAFARARAGLRALGDAGVKRGVRFTLTPDTHGSLDAVLRLLVDERIDRFCMYHLVPAGRGARCVDVSAAARLDALHRVFSFAAEHPGIEVLTVDNPSDGPALVAWLRERDPSTAREAERRLRWNRGARGGPGVGVAAVDQRGDVHPDQFSRHRTLGNVRTRPFSAIWSDNDDQWLRAMRAPTRPLPLPCRSCDAEPICGGGLRSRAEITSGDPWAFDPSCTRAVPA
jgi:radical SAM protein with 4Fe4S-binding SPASM domain